jgi:hypothetical protein
MIATAFAIDGDPKRARLNGSKLKKMLAKERRNNVNTYC